MGKKGETTRQTIRAAAFELFSAYGYNKVTMQDICDKSGLSKGGLYRHYEDKCQLFTDILYTLQKEEADKKKSGIEQGIPALEILNVFLNHLREDLKPSAPNINIALYEFCVEYKDGIGKKILSAQYERGNALWLSLVKYGTERGEFHAANPQAAVSTILFLVEGLRMINEVMEISDETIVCVLAQIKEILGVDDEA